jgi:hypothetical protein
LIVTERSTRGPRKSPASLAQCLAGIRAWSSREAIAERE